MTKRRKKSSQPNLPKETLERARREAGLAPEELDDEEVSPPVEEAKLVISAPSDYLPRAQAQARKRRREVSVEEMTHEEIVELLANPTKQVTLEQLQVQYAYVVSDLRGMGILAALLFVVMIAAARLL